MQDEIQREIRRTTEVLQNRVAELQKNLQTLSKLQKSAQWFAKNESSISDDMLGRMILSDGQILIEEL